METMRSFYMVTVCHDWYCDDLFYQSIGARGFCSRKHAFLCRQNCTWDLQQCLTRRNSTTPRSMQLDFIFLHQSDISTSTVRDDNTATKTSKTLFAECDDCDLETSLLGSTKALEMTVLSTAIVDREKFFGSSPLSDHYGLLTEIQFLEG